MGKSNLLETYEAGKARRAKTRPLPIGDTVIDLPRLSQESQVLFEIWMRKNRDRKFSLASATNKSLMQLARAREGAMTEWKRRHDGKDIKDLADSERDSALEELREIAFDHTSRYIDEMFSTVDIGAMGYALFLAVRQAIGSVYKCDQGELPITEETISTLLETVPRPVIYQAFLWVSYMQDWAEAEEKKPDTAEEALNEAMGDPKVSAPAPVENSTSSDTYPSSSSYTVETTSGSGG